VRASMAVFAQLFTLTGKNHPILNWAWLLPSIPQKTGSAAVPSLGARWLLLFFFNRLPAGGGGR